MADCWWQVAGSGDVGSESAGDELLVADCWRQVVGGGGAGRELLVEGCW